MARTWLQLSAAALIGAALAAAPAMAQKKYGPGVSDKEIKIGQTNPYSGNASSYSSNGKTEAAYFSMINAKGGVNGRKINFISLDDGYTPSRTVEQVRKLVEQEEVLLVYAPLGTPTNSAIHQYLNAKKVPQLFVATGATKWGDPQHFPWTMGWQPNYQTEAKIYAKYIVQNLPNAKIGVLYQNDDYGHDYLNNFKAALKNKNQIVDEEGYEVTTASVQTQVVKLKSSGADTFLVLATPKFTIQGLVIAYKLGWKPKLYVNSVSATDTFLTIAAQSAGSNDAVNGVISDNYLRDPGDPTQRKDPAVKLYFRLMGKYGPNGARLTDILYLYGMAKAHTFVTTLYQAGKNPTRDSLMRAATHLKEKNPFLLPGITIKTAPSDYFPICNTELTRWNNGNFSRVTNLIKGC